MNYRAGISLHKNNQRGFTIVELLIVIVVIAILAAITLVSFNGVRGQAALSVAKVDLRTLAQQMELFHLKNGRYPDASHPPTYPDFETVLKDSNLYTLTRRSSEEDIPARSFLFCQYPANDRYVIIAVRPILTDVSASTAGVPIYYTTSDGVMRETTLKWDSAITGSGPGGRNLCKSVDPSFDAVNYDGIWSYHVPTAFAP